MSASPFIVHGSEVTGVTYYAWGSAYAPSDLKALRYIILTHSYSGFVVTFEWIHPWRNLFEPFGLRQCDIHALKVFARFPCHRDKSLSFPLLGSGISVQALFATTHRICYEASETFQFFFPSVNIV